MCFLQECKLVICISQKSCLKLKIASLRYNKFIDPVQLKHDTQYFTGRLDSVENAINRAKGNLPANNSYVDLYRYVLGSSEIICSTLSNCASLLKYVSVYNTFKIINFKKPFIYCRFVSAVDLCIVDEATNCSETLTLLPLLLGVRSLVLVGDSHQLPNAAITAKAREMGLHRSLFERICSSFAQPDVAPVFRLGRQYRMHPAICAWPSQQFYGERMQTDALTTLNAARFPLRPYVMLNIILAPDNSVETRFLKRMLRVLAPYVKDSTVGIITPKFVPADVLTEHLRFV